MEVTGIIPYPYFRILQREPSYAIGENVNWYSHYGEHYGGYLKILKIDLPYDPAIPLLGIYPKKIQKDKYTPVFTAALFPIAMLWKQPTSPLINEWIKEMQYVHVVV